MLGVLLLIALIAIFSNRESGSTLTAMINPGELSSSHSGFPVSDRCENCHQAHDKQAGDWILSAFEHQDLTSNCVQCHKIPGPARAAHNREYGNESDDLVVECKSCHQEHKGSEFDISRVSDQVCSNCHQQKFDSFTQHVSFGERFPHQEPANIFFNHTTHLGEYFVEESWLKKDNRDAEFAALASNSCSSCHQIETAMRDVPVRDYETTCASCHDHQIGERSLTILTPDEAYPVLLGLITPAGDEVADSEDAALELIETISNDGLEGLFELVEETGVESKLRTSLFSGLNPTVMRETARAWSEEESIEIEEDASNEIRGWISGENDDGAEAILYKASGHADATLKLWIELYLRKLDGEQPEHIDDAVTSLMDSSEGSGACGKCHASVTGSLARGESDFKWGKTATTERPHSGGFNHLPHIDLLGNTEGCEACHQVSKSADYSTYFEAGGTDIELYQSNFGAIKNETCSNCHNEKRVSSNCQTCHSYHSEVGFQIEYQQQEKERIQQ
jgi:predicted CXXCH cytochrome family protein